MGASMNMLAVPPHQLILAGFVLGAIGALAGSLLAGVRRERKAASPA